MWCEKNDVKGCVTITRQKQQTTKDTTRQKQDENDLRDVPR